MKTTIITLLIFALFTSACHSSTGDKTIEQKIRILFEKQAGKKHNKNSSLLLVHCDSRNIHTKSAYSPDGAEQVFPDQTYHMASVGKTFTSVLYAILEEDGLIDYEDPVSDYLEPEILEGLFVVKGTDYSSEVKIHHLLNHTSGAADFYTDKPENGPGMIDLMVLEPDHMWYTLEVLDWTRENLEAHFAPGEDFHYSDTGYELLALIAEKITGKSFEESLHERIFDPLGMKNTYMMHYSSPAEESPWPMCDLYYEGVNLSETNSSSFGRAGGGTVSTTEDLLKFIKAIIEHRIISEESFDRMQQWQKFGPGIDYGFGLMRFRGIGAPEKYMILGNSGSIGTYMYYNEELDTYFIGTFNHVNYERQPIMLLFKIMRLMFKEG